MAGTLSIVILVSLVLSVLVSEQLRETALQREINVNANFIMTQAHLNLGPEDFTPNSFEEKEKIFSNFFAGVDTSEIIRIKVWSTDGTILFSNDKSIVGQNFWDNEHFQESLGGQISAEIKAPEKAENVAEKGYAQLMEIYVPITGDDGDVFGIIETYTSLDNVNASSAAVNSVISGIMLLGSSVVVVSILVLFLQLQKNAIGPILRIQKATKEIANGNFDIRLNTSAYDDIKTLSNNVETMSQELKKQRDDLKKTEKLSAIGELSARLSHDLRNPLHLVKNTLALIKDDYKDKMGDATKKDFDRVDRAIRRMSHQIESVLDFVNVKSLNVSECSIQDIVKSALEKISKPEGIKIGISGDARVNCDATKMEIVVENLVKNSIQAINGDGAINIKISGDEKNMILQIEDSGPGISDDVLPRIFEPLFTTRQEGTGLGLATCKSIVEQHGGTIEVKAKPTVFSIRIPKLTVAQAIQQKDTVAQ